MLLILLGSDEPGFQLDDATAQAPDRGLGASNRVTGAEELTTQVGIGLFRRADELA